MAPSRVERHETRQPSGLTCRLDHAPGLTDIPVELDAPGPDFVDDQRLDEVLRELAPVFAACQGRHGQTRPRVPRRRRSTRASADAESPAAVVLASRIAW
jgi:hypothetical protein